MPIFHIAQLLFLDKETEMGQVIIYKQDSGVVAIMRPTEEALETIGIIGIAKKDVPLGRRFKIIDESDLPPDNSQRNAWTVDEKDLTDGIGGGV